MRNRISFLLLFVSIISFAQEITFFGHVQAIVLQHCAPCHREKGTAPFSLETYDQVAKHAKMMQLVTEKRYMPPWKANPNFSHFANERILPDSAIEQLKKWVESGAKKGIQSNVKVNPNAKQAVRKPDLILKMPKPIMLPGDNKQRFYCYKIPFEILKERPVRAIEYVPGNRKMVHHASYQIVETSVKAPIFAEPYFFEYNSGISGVDDDRDFKFLNLTDTTENFQPQLRFHTGWLPGTGKHEYPKGIGFTMPKRGVLLIRNLHYSATPVPESDQSEIHIYYADQPVSRVLEFAAFKPRKVANIIPKDTVVTYSLTIRIGSDMSLLNINPHMHKLGKYFKAYVITPAKDTIKLVEILDWDFNWQEFYRFKHPIKIPKGSVLNAEARYDNTARNMNNPNRPPIDIAFERGNMDDDREEMMRLVFVYLPYNEGDEKTGME